METRCLTNGELRAFADEAVTDEHWSEWAQHLDGCAACRTRLARIVDTADTVATLLSTTTPSTRQVDEDLAWQRVDARRGAAGSHSQWLKGDRFMNRLGGVGRRSAIAGVAVIALMVVVIAVSPIGSLADNMLNGFRVQQFSAITFPLDLVSPSASASSPSLGSGAGMESFVRSQLMGLGTPSTTLNKESLKTANSVADAQAHLNGDMEIPSSLSTFSGVDPTVYLTDPGTVSYELNVQRARDLFALGKLDPAPLPDPSTTPTATFKLDVPAGAALDYEQNGKHLVVAQMESPTLTVPSSVDMSLLRDELLSSGFLPPDTVAQLRAVKDWQHTLIIPVPSGATTSNETVQGSPALLIKSDEGQVVLWQKDGILHMVGTNGDASVMSVADSLH
ncbi:MAG TPA: hypothetical protein VHA53_01980 [Nitrolancea sp.]|nr:hypothetical protein [Nitrolancea sp.]